MAKKPPRRSEALRMHIADLNSSPVERYIAIQRERMQLQTVDGVDIDMEQMVSRRFLCDRHRCIQWTPHEKKATAKPIIDNSCCARYDVPVTDLDRRKLAEILPLVRKRLARSHPLNLDPAEPPYDIEDDFSMVMRNAPEGACQFVLYEKGLTTCAIHKTCLEEGLPVEEYKPMGCSMWPVSLVEYEHEGKQRLFLTVYANATKGIFASSDNGEDPDEGHFACLIDQQAHYEPMYQSVRDILTQVLGAPFYQRLDRAARDYLERT
jgi:hypothetical protein